MGSWVAHLNYFHTRVAGVNFCFFIAVPSGGGCRYYVKCVMLLRKIDGEMNMQNCGYSAKWRRWWHAPWLTAMAVATYSRRRFSKTWYIANVKNIAGDDQATLMVNLNSANIAYNFRFYVYEIVTVAPRLTAMAVATIRAIVFRRDDTLPTSKTSTAMTRISQISAFSKMKQDLLINIFCFAARMPSLWFHCAFFFLLSLATAFVLTYEK